VTGLEPALRDRAERRPGTQSVATSVEATGEAPCSFTRGASRKTRRF